VSSIGQSFPRHNFEITNSPKFFLTRILHYTVLILLMITINILQEQDQPLFAAYLPGLKIGGWNLIFQSVIFLKLLLFVIKVCLLMKCTILCWSQWISTCIHLHHKMSWWPQVARPHLSQSQLYSGFSLEEPSYLCKKSLWK